MPAVRELAIRGEIQPQRARRTKEQEPQIKINNQIVQVRHWRSSEFHVDPPVSENTHLSAHLLM